MRELMLSAALALLVHVGSANAFSWDGTKEKRALDRMRQFQTQNQVPTVAASIVIDGKTFLSRVVGAGGAVDPDGEKTRYHIGSVTKQFTAAAILALIEDGTMVTSTGTPFSLNTTPPVP
jgi:CubicO group peptidase (beta-lactamase class C family)